jgi:16S rRNA (guanine527-N7)-methyltransferase
MSTTVEKPLSDDVIRRALSEFNVSADPDQVACIQAFIRLLRQWNEKLNLTAIRDPLEILHRHFCESMFAATAIPLSSGRLADLGSGPGFPGLPLKIIQPELDVVLVESNIKKGTFIAEVIRELGLNGARVLISRYEELGEEVAPLDYVCSRALGEFESFLNWAGSDRVAAGRVVLRVGGRDVEEVRKSTLWEWQEPIAIPNSLRRFLLVGAKKAQLSA